MHKNYQKLAKAVVNALCRSVQWPKLYLHKLTETAPTKHCSALRPVLRAGTERPILCWKWQWHTAQSRPDPKSTGKHILLGPSLWINSVMFFQTSLANPDKTVKLWVSVPYGHLSCQSREVQLQTHSPREFGREFGTKEIQREWWRHVEIVYECIWQETSRNHRWICNRIFMNIHEYSEFLRRTGLIIPPGHNHASNTKWRQKHLLGKERYV